MKKLKLLPLLLFAALTLCSCGNDAVVVQGKDGMLSYAKETYNPSLISTGSVWNDGQTLAWFTTQNKYDRHYVPQALACTFNDKKDDAYEFVTGSTYRDAASTFVLWQNGIVFHIEDKTIGAVTVTSPSGAVTVSVTEYPFNAYLEDIGDIKQRYEDDETTLMNNGIMIYYSDKSGNIIYKKH